MNHSLYLLRQARNTALKAISTGIVVFATVEVTTKLPSEGRSSQIYHDFSDKVVTPFMRSLLKPEDAHNIALFFLQKGFAPKFRPNSLEASSSVNLSVQTKDGLTFPSCVGLAAGFDKDGVAIKELMNLGFGFVEIGSVTPKPQPGNPKPRMFRLIEDEGIINRFGFNSIGLEAVERNLKSFRDKEEVEMKEMEGGRRVGDEEKIDSQSLSRMFLSIGKLTWNFLFPPLSPQPPSLLGVNLGKNKTSTEETAVRLFLLLNINIYRSHLHYDNHLNFTVAHRTMSRV